MTEAPVREGDVLAGKYRVERVLGIGGMGVVVAARHLQLDEHVALKFLLPGATFQPEIVARFAREARAAAKIKSEHVARVMDVGVLEGGEPYLVMEYLSGVDLAALVKQRGALAVDDALEYVLQACEALGEAHSLGIVHRDLKPGNLFLARRHDGSACLKVLDFGISKVTNVLGGDDYSMTATHAMLGSPLYMSPEQLISAKAVDHRSDVWSLGVILYELLTGVTPFTGETLAQLAIHITQEQPRPMRDLRPDLPPGIEEVVLGCLEKDAGKRAQNVGELARDLLPFAPSRARISVERVSRMMRAAGLSASAVALPPSSEPVVAPQGITAAAWGRTRPGARNGGTRVALGGSAVLAVLGTAGWFALRPTPEPGAALSATASSQPPAAAVTSAVGLATSAPAPTGVASLSAPIPVGALPLAPRPSTPAPAARRPRAAPPTAPSSAPPTAVAQPSAASAASKEFDFGGR